MYGYVGLTLQTRQFNAAAGQDEIVHPNYRTEETTWIELGKAQIQSTESAQQVGLFVNSASPDLRLVAFEYLSVESRR